MHFWSPEITFTGPGPNLKFADQMFVYKLTPTINSILNVSPNDSETFAEQFCPRMGEFVQCRFRVTFSLRSNRNRVMGTGYFGNFFRV